MNNNLNYWIPEEEYISIFRRKILKWYDKHGRNYPWRTTRDHFRVLIAEIMLRRTKADQVRPVYEKVFKKYPDVKALSEAKSKDLAKILYPLGLKWRIPVFKLIAIELMKHYKGKIPENRNELKTLSGIGDYVAGAVLSIAFNKKEWIIDSNIVRVFKRYFGVKTSKEGRRDKHLIEIAKMYIKCRNPKKANLALLDFASLVCKPREPEHAICPLADACSYFNPTTDIPG